MLKRTFAGLFYFAVFCGLGQSQAATINIAPINGVASASNASSAANSPEAAIDGDELTQWNAGTHASVSTPQWLVVDLQKPFQISEIILQGVIWTPSSFYRGFNNEYNLSTSTDGVTWATVGSGTLTEDDDPAAYSDIFQFTGTSSTLRYVKYEVVGGTHWAHLSEMEIRTVPIPSAVWLLGSGLIATFSLAKRPRNFKISQRPA